MLRPFQVNVGSYLVLNRDILPTAKVAELCSSIEAVSGEKADSQVLLTADGKQMDPRNLIGNYSVGTEDKPLFVFYRSYISTSDPPITANTRLPHKGSLQKQLEILRQRPSPSLFQHQVALSKRLCEYSVELGKLCDVLAEEYALQLSGWRTVLSNCSNLIGMFQKHHQLFCKAVEKFKEDKSHHLELLQQFPEQVKLLQQLPMPSSLQKSSSSSLYDWISTHDEKNSLMDLSTECKKALAKVDGEQLETALQSWDQINEKSSEVLGSEDKSLEAAGEKIKSECLEVRSLMETIMGLSKNIQLTSDKAFRSGDAKTIAVLVESHHKSLQLMANHSTRLETIAKAAEDSKRNLTSHIHARLKLVMQLQKKVADSNGKLVLLHEHIKLARRRFEILEQVCSTPQVLVEVFSEVSRRRSYNTVLEKVMEDTSSRLHRAREEEKRLRKSFQSSHGVHFVTSLFPELQDRVPDITFHSPKSLSKRHEHSLEDICSLLPQSMRPSTELASSVQLLIQPTSEDSELPISPRVAQLDSTSPGDLKLLQNESSHPSSPRSPAQTPEGSEESDKETLKELVGKLELSNVEISSKLQQSLQDKAALQASLTEKESACLGAAQRLKESEELVSLLQSKVSNLEASKTLLESEKLQQSSSESTERLEKELRVMSEQLESEKEKAVASAKESTEKLEKMSQKLQVMSMNCEQLTAEKEKALTDAKESTDSLKKTSQELSMKCEQLTAEREQALTDAKEQIGKLQIEHAQTIRRLEEDCANLRDDLTRTESKQEKELLALQALLSQANSEKQELMESKEELQSKQHTLESRISEMQETWGVQRQSLEQELARYQEEQKVQKETLVKQSSISDQLNVVRGELQEREQALELCEVELASLKKERESAQREMQVVRDELGRQQLRSQQAQATMNSNRAQLEAVDGKRKELIVKLGEKEMENIKISAELKESSNLVSELQKELAHLKRRHAAELKELEGKLQGESEQALCKAQSLENTLNQKQPSINDLEMKLDSAKARISELEAELSRKKEKLMCAEQRLQQKEEELRNVSSEASRLRTQVQASGQDRAKQKDDLEHRLQEMQAKLEKTVREHEIRKKEWSTEKDGYIIQVMELEREVKELRRDTGQGSPPEKQAIQRMSSSTVGIPSLPSSSASPPDIPRQVAIHSLQIGQVALFMTDPYGNYLALTLDSKTYYLDSDSAQTLADMAIKIPHLKLRKKILVGKITSRLFMEVRKENNRLKVPVGSRLYKLQAEHVTI